MRNVNSITAMNNVEFYEDDLQRGAQVRAQEYVKTSKKTVYILKFDNSIAKDTFCSEMGFSRDKILLASSLPKRVVNRSYSRHSTTSKVFVLRNGASTQYSYWEEKTINLSSGGVYVNLNNYSVLDVVGVDEHPRQLYHLWELLDTASVKVPVVYGIRNSTLRKAIQRHSNWVHFNDWLKPALKGLFTDKAQLNIAIHHDFIDFSKPRIVEFFRYCKNKRIDFVFQHPIFGKFASKCLEYEIISSSLNYQLNTLNAITNITKYDITINLDYKLGEKYNDILTVYPMFNLICFGVYDKVEAVKLFQHYVEMVDRLAELEKSPFAT